MLNTTKLLSTLLLTITVALNAGCNEGPVIQLTPKNTFIASDLDDVLFKRAKSYFSALKSSFWSYITTGKAEHPGFTAYIWHADLKSLKKGFGEFKRINGEHKYIEWMEKGLTEPAEFVRSIAQRKEIIPETLELYKKLHAQGFQFYTATNIGSIFFGDLQQKFPHAFNDNFIKLGMAVDYSVKNPIEKPNLRYFEMLKAKINPTGDKYIVFIDDKKENVEAARKAGLLAIQFKNAKQLEEDLKNLYGITL